MEEILRAISGEWKADLKTLPEPLKEELRKWGQIHEILNFLKFNIISFEVFKERLTEIVNRNSKI